VQYVYVLQEFVQYDATSTFAPIYAYTAPSTPMSGQFWFDLSTNLMKKYNGTTWVVTPAIFLGEIDVTTTPSIDAALCEPYRLNPYRRYEFFGNGTDPSINSTTTIDGLKQVPVLTMNGTSLTHTQWTLSTPSLGVMVYSQNPVMVINSGHVTATGKGRTGGVAEMNAGAGGLAGGCAGAGGGGGGGSGTGNSGGTGGSRSAWTVSVLGEGGGVAAGCWSARSHSDSDRQTGTQIGLWSQCRCLVRVTLCAAPLCPTGSEKSLWMYRGQTLP